jgi:UDP-N-acetylglucosamine 1-carboxyvinyltransferase
MDRIKVTGGRPLKGRIEIGGAKNAALPLMAACLLTEEKFTLTNLPHLADIATMAHLLSYLNVHVSMDGASAAQGHQGRVMELDASSVKETLAPYDIVRRMRASVVVLGPLLARFGHAKVSLPGGCAIGTRPIDLHLKALEAMGAEITLDEGYVIAKASKGLQGAEMTFPKVSVGATENILMAAALANGTTVMHNAAREPEVTDLAECLVAMGAKIEGIGESTITIHGQPKLHGVRYKIIADRIEAGTYAVAALMTNGKLEIAGINPSILGVTLDALRVSGAIIEERADSLIVSCGSNIIHPMELVTDPFPGFATDMQAQMMALATIADGTSHISETIFENRFMHVPELMRMGANITVDGNTATIHGVSKLKSAEVMATDLRASVSLVLAALVAEGTSTLNRVYHIDRGYERVEDKLKAVGAQIERVRGN